MQRTRETSHGEVHAHLLIAKTAKELAGAFYEKMASGSDHWAQNAPKVEEWTRDNWPMFLQEARATLARMLATQISEDLKETIKDALIKDASLIRGRISQIQLVS